VGVLPFAFEHLSDGGATLRGFFESMKTDIREKTVVWIVTRREDKTIRKRDGSPYLDEDGEPLTLGVYHIQGVFSEEVHAVAACRDASYLVGSLAINLALPHAAVEWVGSYFPLRLTPTPTPVPFWRELVQVEQV
jgi:hypothetical protein